jgi:acyl transferase domain-containing protein
MVRKADCVKSFLEAFGHIYQQGVKMDFAAIVPAGRCLPDLPTYPWDHAASYWYGSRVSKDWRFRKYGHHAIPGQRIPESTSFDPCWRVVLSLDDESWLGDHKVQQDVILPLAGYVAMAGEAIRQSQALKLATA